jgi:hypothetical protein
LWPPFRRRSPRRQLRGQQNRLHHAAGVCLALPGDVERRPVIDRRTNDGQTERHVHGLPERHQLDRHQPLVVIRGHHHIELAAHGADEQRVGGKRSIDVDAGRPRPRDRRPHHVLLFAPHQAVFARVRVQSCHGEARRGESESRQ